jgi:hypothetical protein
MSSGKGNGRSSAVVNFLRPFGWVLRVKTRSNSTSASIRSLTHRRSRRPADSAATLFAEMGNGYSKLYAHVREKRRSSMLIKLMIVVMHLETPSAVTIANAML